LAALFCLSIAAQAAPPEILTVAVFDFESKDENVRDLGPKIAALINATLSAEPQIITVERAELDKVLGEQELGLSGTVSPGTAAKVGQLTGAKVLVTGRVFKLGKETMLVTKIISTETSRVYGEVAKGPAESSITDLASELAQKIAKVVTEKGDTLVAKVETRNERIAKLKEGLKGAKRPSVFVKLPERHYGAPANDPAAETELMSLLKETGFTLADDESKADVVISGEAFSAAAGCKGNLFICKARVEVKAMAVKSGEVLAVDRETSAAGDLAEQTAGKTALQQAAGTLAARVLPKLVK
jgi:hypothetical protein